MWKLISQKYLTSILLNRKVYAIGPRLRKKYCIHQKPWFPKSKFQIEKRKVGEKIRCVIQGGGVRDYSTRASNLPLRAVRIWGHRGSDGSVKQADKRLLLRTASYSSMALRATRRREDVLGTVNSFVTLPHENMITEKKEDRYDIPDPKYSIILENKFSERRKLRSKNFQVRFIKYDFPTSGIVRNIGKSIIMTVARKEYHPSIVIDTYGEREDFNLKSISFHWPGLHVVDNERYDMEVFMHHMSSFLRKSIILVFLCKVSENAQYSSRKGLTTMASLAKMLTNVGDSVFLRKFVPSDIMSRNYNSRYYTFTRTFSEPFLNSDVVWFVQREPIMMGRQEYEDFLTANITNDPNMQDPAMLQDHVLRPITHFE